MKSCTAWALPGDSMTYGTWISSVTTNAVVSSVITTQMAMTHHQRRSQPRRRGSASAEGTSEVPVTIAVGVLRFVIALVVLGAALAIAARIAMNGTLQPATDQADRNRDLPRTRFQRTQPSVRVATAERVTPTPWWVRARSMVVLSVILAVLGAFLALLVVLGGALILTGLKNAVQ